LFRIIALAATVFTMSSCSVWRAWFGGEGGGAQTTYKLQDIEDHKFKIGDGDIYVVAGATANGFRPPKVREGLLPANVLADPELHLIHVVNLAGRLPTLMHRGARSELDKLAKRERRRIESAHRHLGMKRDPADAIKVVFDPDGETSQLLGLDYGRESAAVAIFDGSGQRLFFKQGSPSQDEIVAHLSMIKSGRSLAPIPGGAAAPPSGLRTVSAGAPAVVVPTVRKPAAQAPPSPGGPDSDYLIARRRGEAIAARVANGRLTRFASDMVSFVPSRPQARFGAPGALEDASIASAARARLSGMPGFDVRRAHLKCEMGVLSVQAGDADEALAGAIVSELIQIDGVSEVRVFFR
jgi:hypothetical protein